MVARWFAFDQIARDGEWCAREPDQRNVEFGHEDSDGLEHVPRVSLRVELGESIEIAGLAERVLCDRSGAGNYLDAETNGVCGNNNVGEQDRGVDAVATNGLHRDFSR
jgi:hypothetical protein